MKRRFTFLLAAALLLMSGLGWAQTRTEINWTASEQGYENAQVIESVTFDTNVSATFNKGTNNNAPKYYTTGLAIRCYGGNYFTVTSTSGNLTEITLTFASGEGNNAITTDVGTYENGTWTGSATSVTFTIGGTTGHRRIATFTINYSAGGGQQTVATPTFSPAGGTYSETQNVTISCATTGATIYYTLDGTAPTTSSSVYSAPIAISQTTTVKAMATKTGMSNSNVATATYTIQQLTSLTTIPAIWDFAASISASTPASITFNNWLVTAVKSSNAYVSDGQHGLIIYQSSHGFSVGDQLSGTYTCNVTTYQGAAELTGVKASNLTVTPGQTIPELSISIGELVPMNYSTIVNLGTLTYQNNVFVDATGAEITPYNTFNVNPNPISSLESGKQYTVKGMFLVYNQTKEIAPRSADDFEEVTAPTPTETVATPTFTPAEGTYTEAQNVTIACTTQGATIHYTTDGTTPTANSATYSNAIAISETTTVKAFAVKEGMLDSEVATAVYTINITPPATETDYTLITNANALISGDKYIVVGIKGEEYKALGKQATNNRVAADVTDTNNVITLTPATQAGQDAAYELTLGQDGGYWTLYDAANGGYLYAASSSANHLKVQAENDANGQWTIEIASDGVATIKAQGANTRNWLRLNNNGSPFSCYASGQLDVYLYKAGDVPTPPAPTNHTVSVASGIANGTVNVNPTTAQAGATITVTATPDANYELATLTYTYGQTTNNIDLTTMQFTMPDADVTVNATFTEQQVVINPITIAEARAMAVNEYALVQGVVTFIDGRNVYVQDETAGIDLFLNNNTVPEALAIGDMVRAYGKVAVYKGLVELSGINGSNADEFSILSNNNELPVAVKTIAEILADASGTNMLQSTRVQIVEATIGEINNANNTPITQGENTLNIYKMPVVDGLEANDIVTVIAVIGCFNTPQLRVASAADVTFTHPQSTETVATPTFTPAEGTYTEAQTVTIACTTEGATIYYTLDGTTPTVNSTTYSTAITISETTTVKAIAVKEGMLDSEVATAVYTINNTPPAGETNYTLITNANALISGDKYIVVGIKGENYKALGKQATNNRVAVDVTNTNNVITLTPAAQDTANAVFELTLGQDNGYWTLYDAVNGGYLYAASSSANHLKVQAENDANGQWTIEIASDGVATIKAQGANTRNWLRLNNNGSPFSCYASGQLDVYLYKAGDVPTPPAPTNHTVSVASGIANGTVNVNPTTAQAGATITVTATPDANYELATLTYTYGQTTNNIDLTTMQFTMPDADVTVNATFTEQQVVINPITIAEARAMAVNEYALVQGVVTFIDGRNVYVQDETAGIDLFLNNNTVPEALAIGDMVRAYGKVAVYKGLVELSGINGGNADEFIILSSNNELPVAVKTIAEILADASGTNMLQSTRVQIVDATIGEINNANNTPITQDDNTLNIYKMPVVEGLEEGDLVTVIGVIGCYNTPQLRVATAADVEFTHLNVPSITVNPTSLNGFTYVYEEGPSEVKTFEINGNLLTGTTHIYAPENYELSSFPGDNFYPEAHITINTYVGVYSYTIKVRLKAGLEIGTYNESILISQEEVDDVTIALSGNVTGNQPLPTGDYVRVSDLSQLTSGSKVIFAARYNENANEYFAMTAQASGKPEGVLFTSVAGTNAETLPSEISDAEDTYYWTVDVNGANYTFTNANGDVLGYTSSTNFATGGDNTAWAITYQTSEATAMVPNYSAFVINNVNNPLRAFALNSNHNFGPYHTQNIAAENYNFFIDMFATVGGGTLTCAAPTFAPEGGTYYETQEVTIACSTADATIYYTLDGSDPTAESTVYSEPITVSASMTIKAIAMKEGYENSSIATAGYTIILGAATIFNQDWEGDMNGWTFVTVEGSKPWNISQYSGNHYAYANGYNGGANEQWCISPAFSLNQYSNVTLNFRNAKNYTGPDMQLFFSNNYDGSDPTDATWTELEFNKSTGSFAWAESGAIELTDFAGDECYIGFKYISTETEAAAWEVDDVVLMGFTSDPYLTVTPASLTGFTHIIGQGPSVSQTFTLTAGNISPAPGGTTGSINVSVFSPFEISLDDEDYGDEIFFEDITNLEPTTIYVRMNGTEVGQYTETVNIYASSGDEATVTLSGTVTEEPIPGGDWNRILSLDDLSDGDQVIIAARYDATVGDGYYAMTAGVSGKPDGVLFTSVNNGGMETLPADIVAEADTYLWNVTVEGNIITLTNAAGDALGYSSSTNFAGNENIEWNIALETAGENAMIPNYTGFVITNGTTTNRGIAKNASNKFGAYSTSNLNNSDYNFYLDLFVLGGTATPTVATPVFSVASGTYYEAFEVEITCSTEGATIHYTTDGTDPTAESEVYTEAIYVDQDMTIKAIAMMEGYDDSSIATVNYVVSTDLIVIFNQDWEGDMNGWTFVNLEGNKPWTIGTYAGNHYANANGYGDDVNNEQWCISPAFNLNDYEGVTLTFRNATKFDGPALELYFANDYDGQDPTNASWQPLEFTMSEGNYTWTESGEISLDGFTGSICYIAFRYISTIDEGAAAWEVDDILLSATDLTSVNETVMMEVNLWNHGNEIFVENNTNSTLQMMVFDILGQQMLAKTVATGSVRFSHNLTTGLYVVTLYNGKERMASKIVVR